MLFLGLLNFLWNRICIGYMEIPTKNLAGIYQLENTVSREICGPVLRLRAGAAVALALDSAAFEQLGVYGAPFCSQVSRKLGELVHLMHHPLRNPPAKLR
jgi:hypothetical protein